MGDSQGPCKGGGVAVGQGGKKGQTLPRCKTPERGPRMAQSAKCLTLDFGSGHDLAIRGFEPPDWALR